MPFGLQQGAITLEEYEAVEKALENIRR